MADILALAGVYSAEEINGTRYPCFPASRHRHTVFIIAMSFFGGFLCGFFLHWLYSCLVRYYLEPWPGESSSGVDNHAYTGDEPNVQVDDRPPEYAAVATRRESGDYADDQLPKNVGFFNWFKRSRHSSQLGNNFQVEEQPPSYSSAVYNVEQDTQNR